MELNNMQKNVLRLTKEFGGYIERSDDGWWHLKGVRNKRWNDKMIEFLVMWHYMEYFGWAECGGKSPIIARIIET